VRTRHILCPRLVQCDTQHLHAMLLSCCEFFDDRRTESTALLRAELSGRLSQRVTDCSKERRGEACMLRHGAYRWHIMQTQLSLQSVTPFRTLTPFRVGRLLASWIPPASSSLPTGNTCRFASRVTRLQTAVELMQYLKRFRTCFGMECDTV